MKRGWKRLCCALLTVWLAALSPLAVSAETLEEIQAQQDQQPNRHRDLDSGGDPDP